MNSVTGLHVDEEVRLRPGCPGLWIQPQGCRLPSSQVGPLGLTPSGPLSLAPAQLCSLGSSEAEPWPSREGSHEGRQQGQPWRLRGPRVGSRAARPTARALAPSAHRHEALSRASLPSLSCTQPLVRPPCHPPCTWPPRLFVFTRSPFLPRQLLFQPLSFSRSIHFV